MADTSNAGARKRRLMRWVNVLVLGPIYPTYIVEEEEGNAGEE